MRDKLLALPEASIAEYTITYSVIDASGNASNVSRTIDVVDRTAPDIALIGDAAVSVCRWATYA
ncbi:MAG: hypothetical protein ACXWDO_01315, partial [Bacteroidia bacterium]